ncbi:MAG TPA: response regulator [Candidatus Limiplasma sp.]|nr:response regulator [Candidatus Limiplasma sp.]HRX08625.1 response regulator [Candidatus Limiplasma sp.]
MRLLIVDDDIPTVEVIRRSIDWQAIEIDAVDTAYSAAQARKILRRGQTDIVISDIEMPQSTGLNLLSWVRAQEMDVEFLFLTCHESFDYAKSALKLDAAEYILKPFNARLMSLSLQKTIAKIKEKRRLQESSLYGQWRQENPLQEELNFWLSLFSGVALKSREQIRREIEARSLPVDADARFRLVATRVIDYETPSKELGQSLLFYILESTHSRHLCGRDENSRVVHRRGINELWFFTAVEDMLESNLRDHCRQLIDSCAEAAHVKTTCCIGDPVSIEALGDQPTALQELIERSVAYYGQVFTRSEAVSSRQESQILEIGNLQAMLKDRQKVKLLNTIKTALADRTAMKTLSERTLYLLQQEFLQAVYAHLSEAGVQATRLFADEDSVRLNDQACRSPMDMLRWANYLLERTFAFEDDLRKAGSLVERVQAYIREHYHEDIGRNEIAAEFHLSPEYLAKLYKRKTDQALKDAVWDQRIEEAKRLLRDPEARVSDVAGAVGIDNLSYFTTVFKKRIGVTPQEYHKSIDTQADEDDQSPSEA